MAQIIPTILTNDQEEFSRKIIALVDVVKKVQIDFVDGKFTNSQTLGFEVIGRLEELKNLQLDLHLMVKEPVEWLERSWKILPDRIIGQVEMMSDPTNFLNQVIDGGVEAGIGLDLETPVESVSDEVFLLCDVVLVMAVKAGFGGQLFDLRVIEKIKKIKEIVGESVEIAVDGGLDEEKIKQCQEAGASIFYVGESFWQGAEREGGLDKRYQDLINLVS